MYSYIQINNRESDKYRQLIEIYLKDDRRSIDILNRYIDGWMDGCINGWIGR